LSLYNKLSQFIKINSLKIDIFYSGVILTSSMCHCG